MFNFLFLSNLYHNLEHEEIGNVQLCNLIFRDGGDPIYRMSWTTSTAHIMKPQHFFFFTSLFLFV